MTERLRHLARDAQGRLHCENRAAIEYPDGFGVYAWHGVRVPADIILAPEKLTPARIDAEANAEVRRVMLERFGAERYIQATESKLVAQDEVGELYRRELEGDEPLVMVKVRNSTPEPDGSVRDYWLRVPPDTQTPRAGIAWTFGMTAEEYRPEVET